MVVAHAVRRRELAGQQGRVGGQCQRTHADRGVEDHGFGGERVQRRRDGGGDVIRTERVDRDQDQRAAFAIGTAARRDAGRRDEHDHETTHATFRRSA
jgi:hypothetical protein